MRAGQTAVSGTRGDMRAGQARTERQEGSGTRGDMRAGQTRAERQEGSRIRGRKWAGGRGNRRSGRQCLGLSYFFACLAGIVLL